MTPHDRRLATVALTAAASVGLTLAAVQSVRAIGIPAAPTMYYRGTLEEGGVAITGSRMFTLRLMSAAAAGTELCTTGDVAITVTNGAFEIPLPAACTDAIRNQLGAPEVWQELSLAGAPLGPRTRLGAVPYAVVAERAANAEGPLSAAIAALQAQVTALNNDNPDCPRGFTRDAAATPGTVCVRTVLTQRDEVVKVGTGATAFWIDRYEASVHHGASGAQLGTANTSAGGADDIPSRMPRNGQRAGATAELVALSHAGTPSVNVTWFQANEACRGVGKRLPTGDEWLAAASGTLDNSSCNVMSGGARPAGAGPAMRPDHARPPDRGAPGAADPPRPDHRATSV
jgi:formylglycine-generating enzyme required for sulfatase activity